MATEPGKRPEGAPSPAVTALQTPKGTHDVLWPESSRWEALIATFATLVERAGYGLVSTPVFEHAGLFRRGLGDASEVVGKELYEFTDRDGSVLALRPEGTASVVRAFLQHHPVVPWKAWYVTPMFRHENPQAGRYRQHHQVGIEALGAADADLDVEVISLAHDLFGALGIERYELRLNSLGDAVCRPGYLASLLAYLREHRGELCDEHAEHFERNPMRVLDCKRESCRAVSAGAPKLLDALCDPCREHLARVREGLEAVGIEAVLTPTLVRGLDYYTRTTFEFASGALEGAQNGIGGGGRYDRLVEMLGGEPTPGIGFGIGIERVLLACEAEGVFGAPDRSPDAFVVDVTGGDAARDLTAALRRAGLHAERAFDAKSMKAQMRVADRSGARVALIVGERERSSGTVTLRPLRAEGEQRSVPMDAVVAAVRGEKEAEEP
jgi:histidyl-tRNA synthetase